MSRIKGGLLTLIVLIFFIAVISFFRGNKNQNTEPNTASETEIAESNEVVPNQVIENVESTLTTLETETPESSTIEDSFFSANSDRDAWRECVGGETPRENDNLEDWARSLSAEPPTVNLNNTYFRDFSGKEFRLRYLIDDGPEEVPLPRLQMYSVDKDGNPDDIVRQENMDFEKARREIDAWIGNGQKFYEESSLTYYFEDGEATLETENNKPHSLTVTKGAAVLICSLKGTAAGSRCTCKGAETNDAY